LAMFVDQLSASPHHRLNQILHTLKHVHACELPVHDVHKLSEWASDAISEKQQIVQDQDFNSYMQQPAYVKASLILEAVKMLTEIAPRRRKTVKEHQEQAESMQEYKKGDKVKYKGKVCRVVKFTRGPMIGLEIDGEIDMVNVSHVSPCGIAEATALEIEEKWDATMQTAQKDKGKWEGYTLERLRARKKKLMDKEDRSAAEQKEVRQLNFAIRAKQQDSWGKIKKESVLKEDVNLDKAQTLLAAQDISDRLQKMAEDAAKMAVDDLMPLVDTMKDQFGMEAATAFNNVVKQNLQTVLDSIIAAKDQTDNAINTMETGGMPAAPLDIGQPLPPMGAPAPAVTAATPAAPAAPEPEGEIDFEKEFAAMPAMSGPHEEPLGRAKKEVAEATLTPTQQAAQIALDKSAAEQMVKTPDGKVATPKQKADAKKLIAEAYKGKNPYAIGMSQAIEQTGDTPPLKKSTITLAHKIARGVEKGLKEQQLIQIRHQVQELKERFQHVKESYSAHVHTLSENWIQNQGDLQSAVLQNHMRMIRTQIHELVETHKQLKAELLEAARFQAQTHRKMAQLDQQLTSEPWGVRGQYTYGERFRKFFESAVSRDTWLRYNEDHIKVMETIDPEHVKAVKNRLLDQI